MRPSLRAGIMISEVWPLASSWYALLFPALVPSPRAAASIPFSEEFVIMREHRLLMFAVVALVCYGLVAADEGSKPRKKESAKPAAKESEKKPQPEIKEEKKPKPKVKEEKKPKPEPKKPGKDTKPEPKKGDARKREPKKEQDGPKAIEKSSPEAAILRAIDSFGSSFNAHNAEKTAAAWASDAIYTDRDSGARITGRDKIQAAYADIFKRRPNVTIAVSVHSIRLITPDVAQVEATVTVADAGEPAEGEEASEPVSTDFSAIFKLAKGNWLLDSGVEAEIQHAATTQDNLANLDWLVGEWEDELPDDKFKVRNVFRWNSKQTFMIRSFHVEDGDEVVRQGTQIIGWDPVNERIRSWIFGNEGGFGEGFWVEENDGWLATLSGTMPNGSRAIVTQVLKRTGENSMTSQLIGAEIDGELQPTKPVVKMKRIVADEGN